MATKYKKGKKRILKISKEKLPLEEFLHYEFNEVITITATFIVQELDRVYQLDSL